MMATPTPTPGGFQLPPGSGTSGGYDPNSSPTSEPNATWLRAHGFDPNTFGKNPSLGGGIPDGWTVNQGTGGLIPPGTDPAAGAGIAPGTFFKVGDTVWLWGGKSVTKATVAQTRNFSGPTIDLNGANGPSSDLNSGTPATRTGNGTDPAQISYEYAKLSADQKMAADTLAYQYQNAGLDYDSARRQALATLIANRNSNSVNLAQASGDIAAKAAQFAANPRDAVSDVMYRNAIGGSTPYGSTSNPQFGQYQGQLANKFQELFGGVAGDLSRARDFISAPPPAEYYDNATRAKLGLGSAAADATQGVGTPALAGAVPAAAGNPLADMVQKLQGMNSQQQADFRNYVTGGQANATPQPTAADLTPGAAQAYANFDATRAYAHGGVINYHPHSHTSTGNIAGNGGFGSVGGFADGGDVNSIPAPQLMAGYRPPSSEGGTNMNIHEPSVIMGVHSKHIYATLSEVAPEQVIIKPLPSVQKAQKAKEQKQQQSAKAFAAGGTVNSIPQVTDFMNQLRKQLSSLGGSGGGVGYNTSGYGLPDPRLLAGAPANALAQDPDLNAYTQAGYSSMGISPDELAATIKKFTPSGGIGNSPRVSFA